MVRVRKTELVTEEKAVYHRILSCQAMVNSPAPLSLVLQPSLPLHNRALNLLRLPKQRMDKVSGMDAEHAIASSRADVDNARVVSSEISAELMPR